MMFENKLETETRKWIRHVLHFNPISLLLLRLTSKARIRNKKFVTTGGLIWEHKSYSNEGTIWVNERRKHSKNLLICAICAVFWQLNTKRGQAYGVSVYCEKNNLKRWSNNVQKPINRYSPILETSTIYCPPLLVAAKVIANTIETIKPHMWCIPWFCTICTI